MYKRCMIIPPRYQPIATFSSLGSKEIFVEDTHMQKDLLYQKVNIISLERKRTKLLTKLPTTKILGRNTRTSKSDILNYGHKETGKYMNVYQST